VRTDGHSYGASIGYQFVNTTANPMSALGCGGPPAPELQKLVNGHWTPAYYPFVPACRVTPDFALPGGGKLRGVVAFNAARPELLVDSIDGVYRLYSLWTEGTQADAPNARRVEAISNQFRLVLRPLPIDASH
jgi:hypothetical protein